RRKSRSAPSGVRGNAAADTPKPSCSTSREIARRCAGIPSRPPCAACGEFLQRDATIGSGRCAALWNNRPRTVATSGAAKSHPLRRGFRTLHAARNAEEDPMDDNKRRALASALGQIEKQFGKGAVMRMGDHSYEGIETISTGSLGLDIALGVGGLPRGRVVEIYGPESSGKTTLTLQVIASCQRAGGVAAFVDAEHALDPSYAEKLGVDVDNLLVSQPDTGEQALEIADMLVRSNAVDVVVVDSVAALTPKAEIEGEMGDTHVGLQARLMSQALR